MEAEALKRKERLLALKNNAKSRTNPSDAAPDTNKKYDRLITSNAINSPFSPRPPTSRPKFRSYKPNDEAILENAIVAQPETVNLEEAVQSQLDLLQQPVVIDEIGIGNLAPRKPDWDLKRDVAKKLERLEHRTQRAIAELIRERLRANSQQPTNMLEGVNLVAAATGSGSKLVQNEAASMEE